MKSPGLRIILEPSWVGNVSRETMVPGPPQYVLERRRRFLFCSTWEVQARTRDRNRAADWALRLGIELPEVHL